MKREKVVGIIPARYGSERFPGKVLYEVRGRTILQHAFENARGIKALSAVYIATDSEKIRAVAAKFGAEILMTSDACRSGSDRIAEAARSLDASIIVNLQADEPFLPNEAVEKPLALMRKDPRIGVATAATRIRKKDELYDSNVTKVVMDNDGWALYFSGSLIPLPRVYFNDETVSTSRDVWFYKHLGVYLYRRKWLEIFTKLPVGFLERTEKLEQLRLLENGYRIKVGVIAKDSPCIDTLDDIRRLGNRAEGKGNGKRWTVEGGWQKGQKDRVQ